MFHSACRSTSMCRSCAIAYTRKGRVARKCKEITIVIITYFNSAGQKKMVSGLQENHVVHAPGTQVCFVFWVGVFVHVVLGVFVVALLCFQNLTVVENLVKLLLKRRVFCL